jgi:hypothetical protein
MGAFYGSVHLRTGDPNEVRRLLEQADKKQGGRFLVGPALGGWVAVYAEHHGQDERVAQALARTFRGELLYVLVHDDDVFAYAYYRGGRLLDQYNSCPDYFGDDEDETGGERGGNPEVFRDLLGDAGAVEELARLLAADRPLFASETLQRFAEIVGLRNALTSYEYLQAGETHGVEGWDQFVHVPDLSAEKARQRAVEADLAAAKEAARADGRLLWERPAAGQVSLPVWCPDREGSGFLIVWANLLGRGQCPVEHRGPPWSALLPDTGIVADVQTRTLALSPAGRYLAAADGLGKVRVWDLDRRQQVLEVAQPPQALWVGFGPDEKHLISLSASGGTVTALDGGQRVAAVAAPYAKLAAVHPAGTLVVVDNMNAFTFFDLPSGRLQTSWRGGGRQGSPRVLEQPPGEVVLRQVDPAELEAKVQAAVERQLAQAEVMQEKVRAAFRRAGLPEPANLQERMQQELKKIVETARPQLERIVAAARPDGTVPISALQALFPRPDPRAEQVTALAVSADGRWLFYTCPDGARALAWDDVQAAADEAPAPRYAAEAQPVRIDHGPGGGVGWHRHTHALAHDATANRLLFAGLEGTVRFLDLADGSTGTVLDPPGRPPIQGLGLSRDRRALCVLCQQELFVTGGARKPLLLQVWNYAGLAGRETDVPLIRESPG